MMLQPSTIDELQQAVMAAPRVQLRAGGTKPALSSPADGTPLLDLSRLSGLSEYTPEECTFTALGGTPIAMLEGVLAQHGQYLPFDPPLAAAGATLGGTVAAGINGACRYRYGGIRDFLIGVRIVDGRGRLVRSGGKVVKNAAGFLLHHAMVGSCGTLGVLAELTFKVFPAAEVRVTIKGHTVALADSLELVDAIRRSQFELEAIDIEPPSIVYLRVGGFADALPQRVDALRRAIAVPSDVLSGSDDRQVWDDAREFAWRLPETMLARVPITPSRIPDVDAALAAAGAVRRYSAGGNVALVAWPAQVEALNTHFEDLGLTGQMLIGPPGSAFVGRPRTSEIGRRVKAVLDPDGRFGSWL